MEFRGRRAVLLSIAAHAAALAFVVVAEMRGGLMARKRILPPADRCCIAMLQKAGGSYAPRVPTEWLPVVGRNRKPKPDQETHRKLTDPARPPHPAKAMAPPLPSESTGTGSGSALSGSGSDARNVTPAFPVFSPKPPVTDRALLPAAEQQIVVDVSVSAQGDVVGETLVKGMGNALDQIVLDIVKTWRFQPATIEGKATASEAELIFPFNQSYPITRG